MEISSAVAKMHIRRRARVETQSVGLFHRENRIATTEKERPIRSAKSGNQAEYESGTNRFYYGGNASVQEAQMVTDTKLRRGVIRRIIFGNFI